VPAPRYFTLEEANALIPRIRTLLESALQLRAWLRAAAAELDGVSEDVKWTLLRSEAELEGVDPELEDALSRARGIYEALGEAIAGVESTGARVKGIADGLVDFPSICDGGAEILLCWRLGEPEISHFHELDAGFSGRQNVEGHHFGAPLAGPVDSHPRD
jgi:hypothetical protein